MKIAIITDAIYPFTIGGSEIRNYEVARRLVKKGHEVHIYGGKFWEGKSEIEIDGIKIHGISKYKNLYSVSGKRRPLESMGLSARLFFFLLRENYDLIDNASFIFFNCYSVKLISAIKKTPLVFTWHQYFGHYLLEYFGKIKGTIALALERISTKLAKNHLAVSGFIKSELIRGGVKECNIKIIHNGADLELIGKTGPQGKKYDLIFVGRLNYQKNLPLLVKAVKILKADFPEIKVAIAGKGDEREKLEKLIKDCGLFENFEFLGEIKNRQKVIESMKSAKIFVLPSVLEGFPLTAIEANACGLPVITTGTKYNHLEEYIKAEINGLISKPYPDELSQKIKYLLKNKLVLDKMSKQSVKIAENYNWNMVADKIEHYYEGILNKN